MQHMYAIIPCTFDHWSDPVFHLLPQSSTLVGPVTRAQHLTFGTEQEVALNTFSASSTIAIFLLANLSVI